MLLNSWTRITSLLLTEQFVVMGLPVALNDDDMSRTGISQTTVGTPGSMSNGSPLGVSSSTSGASSNPYTSFPSSYFDDYQNPNTNTTASSSVPDTIAYSDPYTRSSSPTNHLATQNNTISPSSASLLGSYYGTGSSGNYKTDNSSSYLKSVSGNPSIKSTINPADYSAKSYPFFSSPGASPSGALYGTESNSSLNSSIGGATSSHGNLSLGASYSTGPAFNSYSTGGYGKLYTDDPMIDPDGSQQSYLKNVSTSDSSTPYLSNTASSSNRSSAYSGTGSVSGVGLTSYINSTISGSSENSINSDSDSDLYSVASFRRYSQVLGARYILLQSLELGEEGVSCQHRRLADEPPILVPVASFNGLTPPSNGVFPPSNGGSARSLNASGMNMDQGDGMDDSSSKISPKNGKVYGILKDGNNDDDSPPSGNSASWFSNSSITGNTGSTRGVYGTSNVGNSQYIPAQNAISITNLRRFSCEVECFPSTYNPPSQKHCSHIFRALNHKRSKKIMIPPLTWLQLSYKNCLLIFENPKRGNPILEYTWGQVAYEAMRVQSECTGEDGNPDRQGGSCAFSSVSGLSTRNPENPISYPHFQESGIVISVQGTYYDSGGIEVRDSKGDPVTGQGPYSSSSYF